MIGKSKVCFKKEKSTQELLTVNVKGVDSGFSVDIAEASLVDGYTQTEYFESPGSVYLNTNYSATQNTRVVIDAQLTAIPESTEEYALLGAQDSDASSRFAITCSPENVVFYRASNTAVDMDCDWSKRHVFEIGYDFVRMDDNIYTYDNVNEFMVVTPLFIMGLNNYGTREKYAPVKVYSVKIYDNGTLIREYIPARNESSQGAWDVFGNKLRSNASLTVGKDLGALRVYGNTIATQTVPTQTYEIENGITYAIRASEVDGYVAPRQSDVFTAVSNNLRTVDMQYTGYGVYIQDVEGRLWTEDDWDGSVTPNGIAVITSNCRFVMALEDVYSSPCSWGGYGAEISGIVTTTSSNTAETDYLGDVNTTTIINALKGTNDGYADGAPAAENCRSYTFPDGATGYLGAAGEWCAVLDNEDTIATALTACGGTALSNAYWTSTLYSYPSSWSIYMHGGTLSGEHRYALFDVRAFAAI